MKVEFYENLADHSVSAVIDYQDWLQVEKRLTIQVVQKPSISLAEFTEDYRLIENRQPLLE